ncbi:MAG: hypothetical protein V4658_07305 [Bacteroidota bacterium]
MRLKLLSFFLLFLFSIVIAFPGYGLGTASAKSKSTLSVKTKKAASINWKTLLKKCLSKGINLIEEERNLEEDEDSETCKEVCYIISTHLYKSPAQQVFQHVYIMEEHGLMNMRAVPYPPPNCG